MAPPLPTARTQIHVYLRPRCGICGVFIKIGERFVAIIGNTDSSAPLYRTQSLSFTDHAQFVDDVCLCRPHPCPFCESSTESVPIHPDCLGLFLRDCQQPDAWNRLWILAAWQTPWQTPWNGSRYLQFHLEPEDISTSSLTVAQVLNFPKLTLLPSEIVQTIRLYSVDSPLWRLRTAQALAFSAPQDNSEDSTTITLTEIVSWTRGRGPTTTKVLPQPPIIRFTLDAFGIQRIERLSSYSNYTDEQSSSESRLFAFVDEQFLQYHYTDSGGSDTWEAADSSPTVIHFKFGRARFQFDNEMHYPWLWNTPSPAIQTVSVHPGTTTSSDRKTDDVVAVYQTTTKTPLGESTSCPLRSAFGSFYERLPETAIACLRPSDYRLHIYTLPIIVCTSQLRTISLDHVTGLTFFYMSNRMYGVHGHTISEPLAVHSLERLPRNIQNKVVWVHLPIPPDEHIMGMGQVDQYAHMMDCTFMVRMKLAGDIVVGPVQFHHADTYSILDSPPAALVFRDGVDHHVTYFGVIVRNDSTTDKVALISSPRVTTPSRNLLFSTAPSLCRDAPALSEQGSKSIRPVSLGG
ncbi:uncharacterized protein FTOL_01237 [Fusarium torulosum]|uniref:Uncharacterized protein n=1 Tax=Fusarium torulosum TaxID=33205 RepID=A0AAE8LZR7_9HYPO|nr:uncharacterized protein FTOL_01237 [Fusarium torulosum]